MVLLLAVVVGGLLAGRLRARAGVHVPRHHVRGWVLLAAGAALHVGSIVAEDDLATLLAGGAYASLACFGGLNWTVTGFAVAGLGLVLNLVGVVVNNGIPVRPEALVESGAHSLDELPEVEIDAPRHLETDADRAPGLGAFIPVRGVRLVLSFGDLIALVGLLDGVRDLTRRRTKVPEHDPTGFWTRNQPLATTTAKVDHDWGTAPSPAPESGSQYSAKFEPDAAATSELPSDAEVAPSPAHLDPHHKR
ncbi:MAG: DUF5317 family protein [Actinomycetota bacterium]|nr:DUF5317 family protein [Actinomycetota bacterium]